MTGRVTRHTLTVAAPADTLYALVADVTRWPVIFEPTVHVRLLEHDGHSERFQIWATTNGEVKTWTSRRTLDPRARTITFAQERSQAPIGSMGGAWHFREVPGGTEIVLDHDFTAVGDDPAALDWITRAVDHNSPVELAALGRVAQGGHPIDDLVFTFEDLVRLPGAAADAYEFVNRSDLWPDRLPHVSRVTLREEPPGVQDMEMDTVTADGSAHTTRSIRLCFPAEQIVYKQLVPPALLTGHSGSWEFHTGVEGTVVIARHTVAINPATITTVLGPSATVADARRFLRDALGANSRATLTHAGAYAGARVPVTEGTVP
ncbi:actinorhodin polyketide synthase bifunctional cyclase/dehydratase [Actinoplanes cyaneus]|uniref:Actinorhodin polyketide synthase bifunctional cyclase/dehydratase n=1 Tax=Actinoplanes cyaneus TaxID=52696 RepID=A0A919IUI3_9ACTN|nr:aromatase/cyclase [Actinoplanes cyaneus]MCW2139743.1 aromatase [Actinoplanes cyaneus]GID69898.1 actinorhodin polyketide synthase bifunctional cyclase/dehydratase [Actinoplanes cyaneus]